MCLHGIGGHSDAQVGKQVIALFLKPFYGAPVQGARVKYRIHYQAKWAVAAAPCQESSIAIIMIKQEISSARSYNYKVGTINRRSRTRSAGRAIASLQAAHEVAGIGEQGGLFGRRTRRPHGRVASVGVDVARREHSLVGLRSWWVELLRAGQEGDVAAVGRHETANAAFVHARVAVNEDLVEQAHAAVGSDLLSGAAEVGHC
jgi:hypothetical protein